MSRPTRIVIIHPHAKRAVELYRLFTGLGYDVASNWDVATLSLKPMFQLPVSEQAAILSTADICKVAELLGNAIIAADAVAIDVSADTFWAGFTAALRVHGSVKPLTIVGPPGTSLGLQLVTAKPGRATKVAHESEWSDVPSALAALGAKPTTETETELQPEKTDEREDHEAGIDGRALVADRPEDADRDPVAGGES